MTKERQEKGAEIKRALNAEMHVAYWVLRNWLEFLHHRSMIITDRCRHQLPPQFAHLAPQIEIRRKTASQFFAEYRGVPMIDQNLEQKVRAKVRPFL